jgi:hypothetical protein
MKRLLMAMAILAAGTIAFGALRHSTLQLRRQAADAAQSFITQTQLLAQARIQLTEVEERVREQKSSLKEQAEPPGPQPSDALLALAGASKLTAAQSEQLLAELGFRWDSTGDYLVVSKDTLRAIKLGAMHGMKLRDTACAVLAVTPEERAGIDTMTQSLGESYKSWAEAHVQRSEPSGDIVAKYALPADPAFTLSLSNQFTSGILAALGEERGDMLLSYAQSWMTELGLAGDGASTLTVVRYQLGGEPHLNFQLQYSGNSMSTDVSPHQPFPAAFLPLFPNGWADFAQREGFELPKSFSEKSAP